MSSGFYQSGDNPEVTLEAQQWADLAQDWAVKMDGLVQDIDYSSKFYATQSKAEAERATSEADRAEQAASGIDPVNLDDLEDVNTAGVLDGQVISWDATQSLWLPATVAGGGVGSYLPTDGSEAMDGPLNVKNGNAITLWEDDLTTPRIVMNWDNTLIPGTDKAYIRLYDTEGSSGPDDALVDITTFNSGDSTELTSRIVLQAGQSALQQGWTFHGVMGFNDVEADDTFQFGMQGRVEGNRFAWFGTGWAGASSPELQATGPENVQLHINRPSVGTNYPIDIRLNDAPVFRVTPDGSSYTYGGVYVAKEDGEGAGTRTMYFSYIDNPFLPGQNIGIWDGKIGNTDLLLRARGPQNQENQLRVGSDANLVFSTGFDVHFRVTPDGVDIPTGSQYTIGGVPIGGGAGGVGTPGDGIEINNDVISVDDTVLRTTGNQTVSGVKTFTIEPRFNAGARIYKENGANAGTVHGEIRNLDNPFIPGSSLLRLDAISNDTGVLLQSKGVSGTQHTLHNTRNGDLTFSIDLDTVFSVSSNGDVNIPAGANYLIDGNPIGGQSYTAGAGLALIGTQFSVDFNDVVATDAAQTIGGVKTFTAQGVFRSDIRVRDAIILADATGQGEAFWQQTSPTQTDFWAAPGGNLILNGKAANGPSVQIFSNEDVCIEVTGDGANAYARLFEGGAEKLRTTTGGIKVTGDVDITGSYLINGQPLAGGSAYTAGDGLALTGTTFSVNNTVVRTTGNQTINGVKTFGSNIQGPGGVWAISGAGGATFATANVQGNLTTFNVLPGANNTRDIGSSALRYRQIHASNFYEAGIALSTKYAPLSTTVSTSGNQTVNGIKTFASETRHRGNLAVWDGSSQQSGYFFGNSSSIGVQAAAGSPCYFNDGKLQLGRPLTSGELNGTVQLACPASQRNTVTVNATLQTALTALGIQSNDVSADGSDPDVLDLEKILIQLMAKVATLTP